jgi:phospholipase C
VGHGHFSPQALDVLLGAHEGFPAATPTDRTIEIPYGVRVPTFVISPWVTPGPAPAITLDHCSILKTILARFCGDKKPFLSDRVRASQSFEAFLSAPTPRMDVGMPPTLRALPINARSRVSGSSAITTAPLFRKRLREEQVDFHEVSGRLARMLGR